jgi:hypothetical protein
LRKAGIVLGYIAAGLILILGAVTTLIMFGVISFGDAAALIQIPPNIDKALFILPAVLGTAGGIAGILGAALAGKSRKAGGALIICAGAVSIFLNLISMIGLLLTVLFALGAVFILLSKDRQKTVNEPV